MELLTGRMLSSRQLAALVGIRERQVEEHLIHIVKSVGRDRSRRFVLEPSECQDCGFVLKDRSRLTRPSRCPQCRSENTTAPRYGIELRSPTKESAMANADPIVHEVETFHRAFIEGFNREDTDMYLRSFCYPNAILNGEHGMTINAKESDQQRFYQEVMSAIQSRGWDHTGVEHLQAWPFADNLAMLVADIARYKKDGSVLEKGRYCYTVRKDGGAWKILTLTEVKPPFIGPGDRPQ